MSERHANSTDRCWTQRAVKSARVALAQRAFRAAVLSVLLGALLAACGEPDTSTVSPPTKRPHVILIVLETTRADHCSTFGYPRQTTPQLSAIAEEGVAFENALAPSPWTAPSHASLFTGLGAGRHGLTSDGRMFLSESHTTLAETLRDAGYATSAFSTNPVVYPGFGLGQGFDTFDMMFRDPNLPYPHAPIQRKRALAAIDAAEQAGEPAFVFLNCMEPHLPYTPPDTMAERFVDAQTSAEDRTWASRFAFPQFLGHNMGVSRVAPRRVQLLSDLYDAEIATLDEEIGRLIRDLRKRNVLDDTLIVITSDHGENLDEHGLLDHMFDVHRTLLHVPLVIRFPGLFEGGKRVSAQVRLQDLFPTILDVCGLEVPPAEDPRDGRTLVVRSGAELTDRVSIARFGEPRQLINTMTTSFPEADATALIQRLWSVHAGGLHLIHRADGKEWLYDVVRDPLETKDLAAARPDDVSRLRALLPADELK